PLRRLAARPFHGRIEWLYRRLNRSPLHSSSAPRDDLDSQSSLVTGRPLHSRGSTPIRFALCRLVPADQRGIASRTGIDLKDLAPGPKHRSLSRRSSPLRPEQSVRSRSFSSPYSLAQYVITQLNSRGSVQFVRAHWESRVKFAKSR